MTNFFRHLQNYSLYGHKRQFQSWLLLTSPPIMNKNNAAAPPRLSRYKVWFHPNW